MNVFLDYKQIWKSKKKDNLFFWWKYVTNLFIMGGIWRKNGFMDEKREVFIHEETQK